MKIWNKFLLYVTPVLLALTMVKACSLEKKLTECNTELSSAQGEYTRSVAHTTELISTINQLKQDTASLHSEVQELENITEDQKNRISTLYSVQYKFRNAAKALTDSVTFYKETLTAVNNNAHHIMNYAERVAFDRDSLANHIQRLYCDPTFHSSFEDEFVTIRSRANRDSTAYDITFRDQILIEHERQKRFLRPDIWTVSVYSASPYSEKTNLASYKLTEQPKRIGLGFHLGATYDTQSNNIKPVLAAGVNYNLLNIK